MTKFLLRICAADRSSSTLFNEYHRLKEAHNRALVARAAAAAARLWRRRASRAPATPLHKRRLVSGCHSLRLLHRRLEMTPSQEVRRRLSAADRTAVEPALATMATTTTLARTPNTSQTQAQTQEQTAHRELAESILSTPITSREDASVGRPRATSLATRNANRLSLTLPIAPPTSDPSRPTPSGTPYSVPPTPVDSSAATSPSDPNDFIIAIAAQERRVLELREELSRAEADLTSLKRQWSVQDTLRKRNEARRGDSRRLVASPDEESLSSKRSVELDRRRLLLQTQNQSTPTQTRRKVIRGGHARTLSLLSPVKTDSVFSDFDNQEPQTAKLPSVERRAAQLNPNLAKRASWQPRSHQNSPSVPSIVEDFRSGLRAFVEDIRQITVGDEPVSGQNARDPLNDGRDESAAARMSGTGFDTIRPTQGSRSKVSNAFESPDTVAPTPGSKDMSALQDRPKAGKNKRFSWTPLGFDSLDDHGWSSWESPTPVKSARWSGSTINSTGADLDDIQPIDEGEEENATPSKKRPLGLDGPILSPKLEEIIPNVVKGLSPSNIKRTANQLLDEWEKSLVTPETADKENLA